MTHRTGNTRDNGTNQEIVVDFSQVREQRLEEKRRQTERIFFRNLLGVYSVTGRTKMQPIEVIDISEDGISFQIPHNPEKVWPNSIEEQIPVRLYFSQDTYLEILVKIQNSRPAIENNVRYTRYGCSIDKDVKSYPAYQQFVKFLRLYSEHSHRDMGNNSIFYL